MSFIKFIDAKHYMQHRNNLTLRATGYLFIPGQIMKQFSTLDALYGVLYLDEKKGRVGIRFLNTLDEDDKDAALKLNKDKKGFNLNINPALNYYGLNKPEKKVNIEPDKEDDLMVIDLSCLASKKA